MLNAAETWFISNVVKRSDVDEVSSISAEFRQDKVRTIRQRESFSPNKLNMTFDN